ncbi:hypothetical protein [Paludibacter sp.]|uniref:hypothetical protein n=1 Tax=Paludibacter sp. TaxID=1898105 RepID=UPI00135613D8|nr:hypothetical protein [Paludibacter sp.]MTK51933.1 hypothetical protein [Paludibacter sp.]
MKKTMLLFCILSLLCYSCKSDCQKPDFFQSMVKYPRFDPSIDRSLLKGFDNILLEKRKVKGKSCWYLSTSRNGYLNIRGYLWAKDSIVYINTTKDCNPKRNQILFNFNKVNSDSIWTVFYDCNYGSDTTHLLDVSKLLDWYDPAIHEKTRVFHVTEDPYREFDGPHLSEFDVAVSLKYGFVIMEYVRPKEKKGYTITVYPNPGLKIFKLTRPYIKQKYPQ